MVFPKPAGRPTFTAPWFRYFFPHLTLPESTEDHPTHVRWEPHLLLMTEEFFAPPLVHLLVLIPKGNYKTTWEAGLADWHLVTTPAPQIFAGASDLEQAKELYRFASHFAGCIPDLEERLLVRESTREIRTVKPGGLFKILASDDSKQKGKKQGKNSTMGEIDEYHAHENDSLATDILSGGGKRRHNAQVSGNPLWWTLGKVANISTAGWDHEGPLGLLRKDFLSIDQRGGTIERNLIVVADESSPTGYRLEHDPDRGRLTICRSATGSKVMLAWEAEDEDDIEDCGVVKLTNPASGVTPTWLAEEKENLTPWAYARYHANRWTLGYDSWVPNRAWSDLSNPLVPRVKHQTWEQAPESELVAYVKTLYPEGTRIVGALDMARYRDTAAIVTIGEIENVGRVPRCIVWRSGGQDRPISYDWPKWAVQALSVAYNLTAFAADDKYADQLMEEWQSEGIPIEKFSQGNQRIGPADTELRKDILSAEFAHDGDPILAAHIMAGKAKDIGPNLFKVVQQDGAAPPPIDACKALSMANALSKFTTPEPWAVMS